MAHRSRRAGLRHLECAVEACNSGYDDCDEEDDNGCEAPLDNLRLDGGPGCAGGTTTHASTTGAAGSPGQP